MPAVLTIDFGSTYTKVAAIDVSARRILGVAQAFTTVATDISEGLDVALSRLQEKTGPLVFERKLACSSAAGGLRMVACGLVPQLTAKAARFAAFGAGAKVIKTYSYELTAEDTADIAASAPDILLLCGGTDGGNKEVIIHNARQIAAIPGAFAVIVAGNRAAAAECRAVLEPSAHPCYVTENVMPTLNTLHVAPAQHIIREVFLQRIILSKGLSKAQDLVGGILMPTPAAVLEALNLLANGVGTTPGIGELMAVDLGGATTDIYSIAKGTPQNPATLLRGLPEPYTKRTVEGDIGMRYSAAGIVEAAGMEEGVRLSGLPAVQVQAWLQTIAQDPSVLPQNEEQQRLDFALAALAIRTGLVRHSGALQQVYTPVGPVYQQTGKDLTRIVHLILTGGALIHGAGVGRIVKEALQVEDPSILIPRNPKIIRDSQYVLASLGLLAGVDAQAAFDILQQVFGKEEEYAAIQ